MSAVHFSINNGTALACGRNKGEVTVLPKRVTCQKCKATRAFKDVLEKKDAYKESVKKSFEPEPKVDYSQFAPAPEVDADRVSPPLVRVSWETFSDFVRENPFMVPVVIARAIDWGNEHNLETWVDVREGGPFYWKGGVA